MVLDNILAMIGISTEPGKVSGRAAPGPDTHTLKVLECIDGIFLGVISGDVKLRLVGLRAAGKGSPLIVDAGDGEVARQLDLSHILDSRIEILESAISTYVGEGVRWLDGVGSSARLSEIVRSGN